MAGSAPTLEMLKSMSIKAGTYIRDASATAVETMSDATKNLSERTRASKMGTATGTTMSNLGKQAAEGSSYLYNVTKVTTQGIVERFSGQGLAQLCTREAKESPCPRMMIVCCTAICFGGLASEGLFTAEADSPEAETLCEELTLSHATKPLPPGVSPQTIAAALKLWLFRLSPEPLLTFKLVPALTSPDTPKELLAAVLVDLPPANRNAFFMLLDTCNRISSNAAINDSDAATLAATLSPCLLWRDVDPNDIAIQQQSPTSRPQTRPLSMDDEAVFIKLLTHMISHYRALLSSPTLP